MLYGEKGTSKLGYAKLLAATLSYLIVHQRDSVTLNIFDLLFRTHYRRIPWAAMKFLLDSIEQTARRLRFQELLLLLLRIALLVLLALTLARPMSSFFGVAGGGDAVDAVLVFDVSYSMDSREGRLTRLETAQAAAQALLDQLPLNSTVQVITVADRAKRWGPRLPARSAQAWQLIESLEVTHLGTDFLPGIAEASFAFQQGDTANKELYLFSDMQPQGWERQPADLVAKLQDLHGRASLYLVQCGALCAQERGRRGVDSPVGHASRGRARPFHRVAEEHRPRDGAQPDGDAGGQRGP